jgi:hypothetical protein
MLKMALISHNSKAHQTWRSGQLLRLGFNEVAHFLSKSEVLLLVALQLTSLD